MTGGSGGAGGPGAAGGAGAPKGGGSDGAGDSVAKLVLIIVVVALLIAFTLGNSERVRVSFVFFHVRSSLIWILLLTNLLGFLAGALVSTRVRSRRERRAGR